MLGDYPMSEHRTFRLTKPKRFTSVVILLLAVALGIFVVYPIVSLFIPRHGTVARVLDLQKVYNKAGPRIAATFTNSLIQKFPFNGPIDWKLILFKDSIVYLNGKVDTNALHQFITSNPGTKFMWTGADNEFETGWPNSKDYATTTWTNIIFKTEVVAGPYGTCIQGNLDLCSGLVTLQTF